MISILRETIIQVWEWNKGVFQYPRYQKRTTHAPFPWKAVVGFAPAGAGGVSQERRGRVERSWDHRREVNAMS